LLFFCSAAAAAAATALLRNQLREESGHWGLGGFCLVFHSYYHFIIKGEKSQNLGIGFFTSLSIVNQSVLHFFSFSLVCEFRVP